MDPTKSERSLAEMDYKGAFSKGQILYGHVHWHPEQNLNAAYKLQLEKVNLCTGRDGYVPFLDPTGTVYNEGPRYGCIQPNKYLKHRFLLLDQNQPEVRDKYFPDVPFDAHFASQLSEFHSVSSTPGVDGFTLKVDALYKELMPSQRQDTSRGGPCSRGAPLEHPRWSCPGAAPGAAGGRCCTVRNLHPPRDAAASARARAGK
ncbi:extracellular matrix organizing protein FRAS1-like isoform X2 [Poecile atricapillus]|uniref:extracellular matrix organizing protein FRAS1-like isoform X2 n=1 Tax=Poecile atricapillus TaxID=48891 RepID=UPI0027399A1B|nr:extracellular matrix organizing protein FRAS1-like isoform X2 [Poecile atricapillus]